ncbi:hypothetical protein [Allocoleopsis franciscana]|uniref:Uncharacterized protein n=1 Tax=Allocoleopsis franciscana PCC 7113 TaxID=1173027 RepID=K9WNR8_9CYAN|nr:hypothetical protein [Allocoleopsis franciscana]AFZ22045.1 hypothetical protein Mic7113_6465 [Allocoleopsis franciscana PCC 7113]
MDLPPLFTSNLELWRTKARKQWLQNAMPAAQLHPKIPAQLPDYFLDRYAYRLFRSFSANRASSYEVRIPDFDLIAESQSWSSRLEKVLSGVPALNIPPPSLKDRIPELPLIDELLAKWRQYLEEFGVDVPPMYYRNPAGTYWIDFFQRSAHFPKLPAIRSPSFYERLSPRQQEFVLNKHGREGIIALYVFLQQTHEETHLLQKGEPMLCEVILAWLWCNFLGENNLWYWQKNDDNGISFNLEKPWASRIFLSRADVRCLFKDTFLGTKAVFGNRQIYDDLCLIAWLFDSKVVCYADYLEIVTSYFENRDNGVWLSRQCSRLSEFFAK